MSETTYTVKELSPVLGGGAAVPMNLTHGVYRNTETGPVAVALCYSEKEARLVCDALGLVDVLRTIEGYALRGVISNYLGAHTTCEQIAQVAAHRRQLNRTPLGGKDA